MSSLSKLSSFGLLFCSMGLLHGCAKQPQNTVDPYESFNRKVYAVNNVADNLLLRPVAGVYTAVTPAFVQKGVHNAYNNLWSPTTIVNDVLQAKLDYAIADTLRFALNSTIGILGLFDPAKHMGLPPHYEDFGMTLATWGGKQSSFLMVPVFGPHTFRDTFAIPFDTATSPITYVTPNGDRYGLIAGKMVDIRAQLQAADPMIAQSFDPYVFVRDAYMQHRTQMIANNHGSYKEFQQSQSQQFVEDTGINNSDIH